MPWKRMPLLPVITYVPALNFTSWLPCTSILQNGPSEALTVTGPVLPPPPPPPFPFPFPFPPPPPPPEPMFRVFVQAPVAGGWRYDRGSAAGIIPVVGVGLTAPPPLLV